MQSTGGFLTKRRFAKPQSKGEPRAPYVGDFVLKMVGHIQYGLNAFEFAPS